NRLDEKNATMEVKFPWFYERKGPQSNLSGLNHADLSVRVTYDAEDWFHIEGSLSVLITTLCPCSKDISEYSAHNQRGRITIDVHFTADYDEAKTEWKHNLLE